MVTRKAVLAVLACAPLAVFAQSESVAHPADAAAKVPAAEYRSAFADYRPYADEKVGKWSEVIHGLGPLWWGTDSQAAQPSTLRIVPRPPQSEGAAPHQGHSVRQGEK